MVVLEFSFPVEIWGTVSEWVMIGVTTATAFFLYKTLQSQKEVQVAQNKLLEIEQLRVREDFKPVIKFSRFEDGTILDILQPPPADDQQIVSIALIFDPHRALNMKIAFVETPDVPKMVQRSQHIITDQDYKVSLHFVIKNFHIHPLSYFIRFECTYQDIAGTNYKQTVLCYKYNGGNEYLYSSSIDIGNNIPSKNTLHKGI